MDSPPLDLIRQHPWAATLVAALVAVFAAMVAHRVGRTLLRRVVRHSGMLQAVVHAMDRPAAAVLPLLALLVVWQFAPDNLHFIVRLRHFTVLALVGSLTWLLISAIAGFAQAMIDQHPATMEDNLQARRIQTQTKVLARTAMVVVLIAGSATALMTFPGARQVGASLLASAGVLGIIGGIAARPVFSNLIAGLQLALAQPLRIDDVLIVQGEWGRVEEITGTYVVLKLWDERRLIIPLQWFIENPFQNWTRSSAQMHQSVFLHVDFATPLAPLRAQLQRIVKASPEWDGRTATLVAVDSTERAMKLRVLLSAGTSGKAFDLGCKVREELYAFLAREYPHCLPRLRTEQPVPQGTEAS